MGVVYRAEDTKLKRTVALKFLTKGLETHEPERNRFLQEAQAASALNHSNICTIYDLQDYEGQQFIVMEFVDGKTLRQLIPIQKLQDAITYSIQIGEALQEAHSHGIVHRDVKPENIMVNVKNQIKVMDFGLAKLKGSLKITKTSSIVGTLAYMSPEQIQVGEVDARSDIFSLGIVLFEIFTAHLPFRGEHEAALVYSIVNEEPESLLRYRPDLSPELNRIIRRSLEKDPEDRYQSVADMISELKKVFKETTKLVHPSVPLMAIPTTKLTTESREGRANQHSKRRKKFLVLLIGVLSLVVIVGVVLLMMGRQSSKQMLATHKQITFNGKVSFPTISPDGKTIAYVSESPEGGKKVYVQDISGGKPLEIGMYFHLSDIRWIPDGSQLIISGYLQHGWGVFLVPRLGGTPHRLRGGEIIGCSPDGSRFATSNLIAKKILIRDRTTDSTVSISLKSEFQWMLDLDWSPKGNLLLFLTISQNTFAISTIALDGSNEAMVAKEIAEISSPRWSSDGEAIYFLQRNGQTMDLMKLPIDPKSGMPKEIPLIVQSGLEAGARFSIAKDNLRLMYTREHSYSNLWLVQYVEKDTARIVSAKPLTKSTSSIFELSISPDGKRIVFAQGNLSQSNIFVMSNEGDSIQQLTFLSSFNSSPVWSPDGNEIAFKSMEGGSPRVWRVSSSGGTPRPFSKTLFSFESPGLEWSPGKEILYERPGNRNFHFINPNTEDERPLVRNDSVGYMFNPRYSPDGQRIAVSWNRFDNPSKMWIISLAGGMQTLGDSIGLGPITWSLDGKLIYAFKPEYSTGFLSTVISVVDTHNRVSRPFLALPFERIATISMDPQHRIIVCRVVETQSDAWLMENFDPEVR